MEGWIGDNMVGDALGSDDGFKDGVDKGMLEGIIVATREGDILGSDDGSNKAKGAVVDDAEMTEGWFVGYLEG